MPAKFELIAPCFFGCESTAKFELTRIGAENIRVEDGRLSFCGGAEMIAAANLNLRTVERVMLLLALCQKKKSRHVLISSSRLNTSLQTKTTNSRKLS